MLAIQTLEVLLSVGWITLLLSAVVGFLILRVFLVRRKNLPPGPTGLPIVGYFPFLIGNTYEKLRDLAKKYGDVMSVNMFGTNYIILSSNDVIREAFISQGTAGRPYMLGFAQENLLNSIGVVQSEGETWKIHRRFALQTLRDFGFGKLSLESRIQKISEDILKELTDSKGKPIEVKELLANSTASVICSLVFDRHFKMDDPIFLRFMHNFHLAVKNIKMEYVFLHGPLISYLPLQYAPSVKSFLEANNNTIEIVSGLIKEHQETFDPNFLRDYVDVYLDEMRKDEASGQSDTSTFTLNRLKAIALDLFSAGTETTSNTIHWGLRLLMFRPEIQRKIHSEIDDVVGRERFPSMIDRQSMPYTEATINEVLRFSSLLPLGVFHNNPEEMKFRDYIIPKKSIIVSNFWAVHHDPKNWPEPEKFDPNRFLSADGKFRKLDNLIPFSVGKRFCLGETLARTELFIFLTSILQHFTIVPPEGVTDAPLQISLAGFIRTLEPFNLCARERFK